MKCRGLTTDIFIFLAKYFIQLFLYPHISFDLTDTRVIFIYCGMEYLDYSWFERCNSYYATDNLLPVCQIRPLNERKNDGQSGAC